MPAPNESRVTVRTRLNGHNFSCFFPPEDVERGSPEDRQPEWKNQSSTAASSYQRTNAGVVNGSLLGQTGGLAVPFTASEIRTT
jgi:hypothetical protein